MAYVTQVNEDEDLIPTEDIEEQKLWLPSDLTVKAVKLYGLRDLVDIELELRKGKAFDALTNVRTAISHELQLKVIKLKDSRGMAANTRASTIMINAANYRCRAVRCYEIACIAIKALDPSCEFRELTKEDLEVKPIDNVSHLGGGLKEDSWLWTFGVYKDQFNAEWEDSGMDILLQCFSILINTLVNRVRWYRAKADAKRWEEEVDILCAEMTRTYQMFKFLCNIWK